MIRGRSLIRDCGLGVGRGNSRITSDWFIVV